MWREEHKSDGFLGVGEIYTQEVLYEFDEPLLFYGRFGVVDGLFSKVSERESGEFYIFCEVSDDVLRALKDGKLSVYGAFRAKKYWIIKKSATAKNIEYWRVDRKSVPSRFFAKPGRGVFHWHGQVPDEITQSDSLISFKFTGRSMSEDGMPLSKLKSLVDQSSSSIKAFLTPLALLNKRPTTFDVEVAPLEFASLLVSAKAPILNMDRIKRINPDLDEAKIKDEFYERGHFLAKKLKELKDIRDAGDIDQSYISENFAFLEMLTELLPKEEDFIDATEIYARGASGFTSLKFTKSEASKIRSAIDKRNSRIVTEIGAIGGYIEKSQTVRLRSRRGKEVTCWFRTAEFERLTTSRRFKKNAMIRLTGELTVRPRIDYMRVEDFKVLTDGEGVFD